MKEEEIIEGNKLIAEFMGVLKLQKEKFYFTPYYKALSGEVAYCHEEDLQYHSSWDWLHPVIEKIKALDPEMFGGGQYEDFRMRQRQVTDMRICVDIDHAFGYVTVFVKWYNSTLTVKSV